MPVYWLRKLFLERLYKSFSCAENPVEMKNGTPSLAGSGRSREHCSGNRVLVPYRPFEGTISSTSSVQLRYARAQKWMLSTASSHAMPSRGQRAYQTPAIHGRYDWWGRVKSASRWADFSLFSFILCLATSVKTQQQKKKRSCERYFVKYCISIVKIVKI